MQSAPTSTKLVPMVPVEVAIWSLGSFRLKGVPELMKVVQILPTSLEGRVQLHSKKGALQKVSQVSFSNLFILLSIFEVLVSKTLS